MLDATLTTGVDAGSPPLVMDKETGYFHNLSTAVHANLSPCVDCIYV